MKHYVVIGNSAAAIGCVEGIRQVDKEGRITLISNEMHHTYSRPLISYLLCGMTDLDRMKYRPDSFYEDNAVEAMLGTEVTKIDPEKKSVTVSSGKEIAYDKLMVATGSRPFIPPMDGLDSVKNKFTFMSLDDAQRLEPHLNKDARVLIIGAGLIGIKCAEGIIDRVGSITIVDMADRVLPAVLDSEGADMIQKHMEKLGVKFYLSDSAAKFESNSALLKSGTKVDFDILMLCVGVRPNTSLVFDAGGNVGRGILTDDNQKTSLDDVYAAGDCTESYDITIDQSRILALLPNAYMQGETAGICMAGGESKYDKAIPMNAGGVCGMHLITAGSYVGDEYEEKTETTYKKLFYKDNQLKGYILIGDVLRAGIYTSLIREKTPLDSIDFDLIKEKPQLMAFSRTERAKKLGGLQ